MSEGEDKPEVLGLLSNLVLLGTAGWGVWTCREHPFITAGFGLFAVRGLIGAVAYLLQPIGDGDIRKLISNVLKRIDRATKVFFFPLVTTEVLSEGCLKDCRLAVFNLLFPAIDYFLVPVDETVLFITRTGCALEILWCNYMVADWKDVYLIVPYVVNELSWEETVGSSSLLLLSSYSCLVTAMYFTSGQPEFLSILDILTHKEKTDEKTPDEKTPDEKTPDEKTSDEKSPDPGISNEGCPTSCSETPNNSGC
ncbi:uncharacterized protein [Halyomorpha halys]|uniref:uncharacterized protein isoform X1 n=1 Tax=Halyomorpha halys TaxID=286706 RepID=UPI0006D528A4|nr:uncharacterized protein LOC106688475 isoform X1 [Halyomorpha halys]